MGREKGGGERVEGGEEGGEGGGGGEERGGGRGGERGGEGGGRGGERGGGPLFFYMERGSASRNVFSSWTSVNTR